MSGTWMVARRRDTGGWVVDQHSHTEPDAHRRVALLEAAGYAPVVAVDLDTLAEFLTARGQTTAPADERVAS